MLVKINFRKIVLIIIFLLCLLLLWFSMPYLNYVVTDLSEFRGFVDEKNCLSIGRILLSGEVIKTPPLMRLIPQILYFFTNRLSILRSPSFLTLFFFIPLLVLIWGRVLWDWTQCAVLLGGILLSLPLLSMALSLRGYILLAFFSLSATTCFCLLVEKHDFRAARWMILFLILGSWTHHSFCIYAVCILVAVWWDKRSNREESIQILHLSFWYFISIVPLIALWVKLILYWFQPGQYVESKGDTISTVLLFGLNNYFFPLILSAYLLWHEKIFRYVFLLCGVCLFTISILSIWFFVGGRYQIPFIPPAIVGISYLFKKGIPYSIFLRIVQGIFLFSLLLSLIYNVYAVKDGNLSEQVHFFKKHQKETNVILISSKRYTSHLYYWLEGHILADNCYGADNRPFVGCQKGKYRIILGDSLLDVKDGIANSNGRFFYLYDRTIEPYYSYQSGTRWKRILSKSCSIEMSDKKFIIYSCRIGKKALISL